jgi:4-hydroxybenzoate polyprenyltransferase
MIGLSLMVAPIGAYISVTGTIDLNIILLGFVVLFWVAGFDILYSIQDEDFDKKNNLHSIPAIFGRRKAILFSRISHIVSIIFLFIWWFLFYSEFIILIGTIIFSLMLLLQNFSIRINRNERINEIFFKYNGIASIIFCLFFLINHFFV